ncbi:death-associated protein kinase related isoform X2 [Amblyomma americanum]
MEKSAAVPQGFLSEATAPVKVTVRTDSVADHYNVEPRPFARGKFATVRRCVHRESGRDFAAKYIRKRRRASDVRHEILHEALVLKMAEPCPRVVDVREVFETPSELILILELAAGGELQHVLDSEECLPEKDVVRLMRQILEAVHFLHDRNIAHLDIKPQNLLLTSSFPQGDILLCDFGISRVIGKGTEIREIVGTPDYVAPEILQYEPISLATDIWSLGVLTYVLLSGHSPFGGDTKQETFCNITNGSLDFPEDLFGDVSASAKDFIGRLIVRDASKRLSVKDCLSHPWLAPVKASMLPSPTKAISQIQPLASGSAFGSASSDSSASEDSDEAPTSKPALPTSAPPTLRPSIRFYHDVDDDDDDDGDLIQPPPLPLSPPPKISSPCKTIFKDRTNGAAIATSLPKKQQTSTLQITVPPRFKRHRTQSATSVTTTERRGASIRHVQEVESVMVELDGLSLNGKRLIFTDEIIVDERVGIVY